MGVCSSSWEVQRTSTDSCTQQTVTDVWSSLGPFRRLEKSWFNSLGSRMLGLAYFPELLRAGETKSSPRNQIWAAWRKTLVWVHPGSCLVALLRVCRDCCRERQQEQRWPSGGLEGITSHHRTEKNTLGAAGEEPAEAHGKPQHKKGKATSMIYQGKPSKSQNYTVLFS